MAAIPQTLRLAPEGLLSWLKDFLKEELTPSPSRVALVVRMTIAATLVMVLTMIFQIPYGAYGAVYALTISRENPQATINAAKTIFVGFAFSVVYVLVGALFFLQDPNLRLLWVIGTMFVVFFSLSAMTNYTAAARFGYLLIIMIPLWDRNIPTEFKVEGSLWAFGAIVLGSFVTVLIELLYSKLNSEDDLLHPIAERLAAVREVLCSYAVSPPLTQESKALIIRYAMLGTSTLRRTLQRSGYSPHYREQMGAVVALVGRLVDLAANTVQLSVELGDEDREHVSIVAAKIATIHRDLLEGKMPAPFEVPSEIDRLHSLPLLSEIELTLALIPEAFRGSTSLRAYDPSPSRGDRLLRIFTADAFSNPEHIKFALKGCFAATLCYLLYNLKDWQGISTSVTTCFLTALTTIGSSRQKQILRIAGAVVGGVMGIGAQVVILPHLDSIGGFAIVFVSCTLVAAWFATASPRLSYFGVQIAVAFYLINLTDFAVQTSLEPARDRVVGILLGLFMMWLVFDQLWGMSTGMAMKTNFVATFRLLAQFSREPISHELKAAIERSYELRDTINNNFDQLRAQADGVVFEFGPSRHSDLALRRQIRALSPQLRTLFVIRTTLLKYRLQLPGFELPQSIQAAQVALDNSLAAALDGIADRLESHQSAEKQELATSYIALESTTESTQELKLTSQIKGFLLLSKQIVSLADSLDRAI
jgi:multidrug resistance protein MdtO